MNLWHKTVVTLAAMLVASFLAGKLWMMVFDFAIPSYLAGVAGGLAAILVWELLRWIRRNYP